jgi:hypothetical protein
MVACPVVPVGETVIPTAPEVSVVAMIWACGTVALTTIFVSVFLVVPVELLAKSEVETCADATIESRQAIISVESLFIKFLVSDDKCRSGAQNECRSGSQNKRRVFNHWSCGRALRRA